MKILNSSSINGNMSKLLETPDNFLINGQVYDKSTFTPIPMSFCPVNISNNNEIMLSQTAYIYSCWHKNYTTNGYMLDSTDNNICYIANQGLLANAAAGITKIVKNPNGSYTTSMYTISSGYNDNIDILCQDSTKIYYTMNREYSGAYSYIAYLDKLTMTSGNINLNSGCMKVLKITDMYIYFANYYWYSGTDSMNIGKYNKNTNTVTWILQDTIGSAYDTDAICSDMDDNGVFYARVDGKPLGMSDHYALYRKYVLDTSKDTCVASTVTVDNAVYPNPQVPIYTNNMGVTSQLIRFTDSNTKKRYITVIVYNKGAKYTTINVNESAMYTYELISDDNWKLVSWTSFAPVIYRACLPILNNQTILLGFENGLHIYTWNSATSSYIKVTAIDNPTYAFGIDNNNNIYIQYLDKSIDMISNVMPINIYCDFDKDEYAYNSTDLNTNVTLYVQNYQNKYLSTSVQLSLYGSCKFTSNNSKTITVTTSNLDKTQIPVTITGEGKLEVTYKIL